MNYLNAYGARLNDISSKLDVVANELVSLGWKQIPSKVFPKTLRILIKDDYKIVFGFAEVPYRWYIRSEYTNIFAYRTSSNSYPKCPITAKKCIELKTLMNKLDKDVYIKLLQ